MKNERKRKIPIESYYGDFYVAVSEMIEELYREDILYIISNSKTKKRSENGNHFNITTFISEQEVLIEKLKINKWKVDENIDDNILILRRIKNGKT